MNKALKVLNDELSRVEGSLDAYRMQVKEFQLALKDAEEMVARYEQSQKELKAAIELIADEN